jgi:hypothetical protein
VKRDNAPEFVVLLALIWPQLDLWAGQFASTGTSPAWPWSQAHQPLMLALKMVDDLLLMRTRQSICLDQQIRTLALSKIEQDNASAAPSSARGWADRHDGVRRCQP